MSTDTELEWLQWYIKTYPGVRANKQASQVSKSQESSAEFTFQFHQLTTTDADRLIYASNKPNKSLHYAPPRFGVAPHTVHLADHLQFGIFAEGLLSMLTLPKWIYLMSHHKFTPLCSQPLGLQSSGLEPAKYKQQPVNDVFGVDLWSADCFRYDKNNIMIRTVCFCTIFCASTSSDLMYQPIFRSIF